MQGALAWLARHGTVVLAAGVLAGLAVPALAAAMRPALTPAVAGLLFLAALRLDLAAALTQVRQPRRLALALGWLLLASPVAVALLADALQAPAGLATALVLMAVASPITSSPAFALLLGLDAALAMVTMVAATLLVPLLVPGIAVLLLAEPLQVSGLDLLLRLLALVGGALGVAALLRRRLGEAVLRRHARALDGLSVLLLLAFAAAVMDGVTATLLADPAKGALFVGSAFLANAGLQASAALAFCWLGRRAALTLGFLSGNRNMAVLLAVLPAGADADVFLYFALAQLPMYILPAALAPLYRRLLRGPAPSS